ncbi:MAG: response regulator [Nitrospiraceae bacterium]|nr:MAG: response regulator [Nitrospiraceae bacterium]
MKEYLNRITNKLAFRILAPTFVIALLSGLILYIFVLRSISDFTDIHIKKDISDTSLDIYNICDKSLNELLLKGASADEKPARFSKALTIGLIEDYMEQNGLQGAIIENGNAILKIGNFHADFFKKIDEDTEELAISLIKYADESYYVTHSHFEPWGWHILLLNNATAYSDLIRKVNRTYTLAAILFLVIIYLILHFLNRYIRKPVTTIIKAIKNSEKPEYKGIYEFEFLSNNIAQTLETLRNETDMLNNLYSIAVSRKGEDFFDEVVKNINRMFGLNSLIGKANPDGETATIIAMHYEGRIKNGKTYLLKDLICKRGHTVKDVCIIETDAYKNIPLDYLASVKADLYLCCNIFDRMDNIIGVVAAFGKQRELTSLDVKIFRAVGQMVAAEFERLNEEEEKETLKEQLFQTQKLEAIGTLAGGIAHDFNNMLQGILGYAAYLKMKVSSEDPMYEPLSVIEHSAERAADLTKKLLGFARKGKYIIGPMNLNAVVKNVAAIAARTFDRKIKIETTLATDLWTVEGDKSQLEHVTLNLCLNSRDAMPDGGILTFETFNADITKEIKPHRYMKEGKYAGIKVIDTGTGMDEETRRRIFEPFFTTKEVGKGTGMGLAMVYGVVKNHDGFITVDSAPGQGSTFTIYLPATEKKAEEETTVSKPLHMGKGTILVIDDEEIIRNVARDILHELGYDAILASGGKEGIAIYSDKKDVIDLVILDMIMSEMGGKETFKKLKKINPDAKILISSGYSKDSHEEVVLDAGEAGFIQKPYNINEIAEVIKEVLTTA